LLFIEFHWPKTFLGQIKNKKNSTLTLKLSPPFLQKIIQTNAKIEMPSEYQKITKV
jgi:hypothetical protein